MKTIQIIKYVAAAAVLMCIPVASAIDNCEYRSKGTGGYWNVLGTWECFDVGSGSWKDCDDGVFIGDPEGCYNVVPGQTHKATILKGDTVTVKDVRKINNLSIKKGPFFDSPGELKIDSGSTATASSLEFPSGSTLNLEGIGVFEIANRGKINFTDGSSTSFPGRLIVTDSISADGEVTSTAATAGGKIEVAANESFTLQNNAIIVVATGDLTVTGDFEQDALVIVDGATLKITGTGAQATSSGDWSVRSGTLNFDQTIATITDTNGNIDLTGGTLDVDKSLTFKGSMTWRKAATPDSKICVASGKVFKATDGD